MIAYNSATARPTISRLFSSNFISIIRFSSILRLLILVIVKSFQTKVQLLVEVYAQL